MAAVGRIKGRCSFELSRRGGRVEGGGWTGNGARGASDRVVGGGGSNGAGRPEVGGWRCSWVEATTSKSDFRSTCYASGSLALHPLIYIYIYRRIHIYIYIIIYKRTHYIIARAYFHPSIKESTFRFPSPRLWHTLTRAHRPSKTSAKTFASVNIATRGGCVKVTRFSDSTLLREGRFKLGRIFEISKGTKVSRESVNGFLCKVVTRDVS